MATQAQPTGLDYITAAQQATLKTPIIGKTDDQVQAEQDAADTALKALEQRYANPNWFNVAAAFFKPQLGGFGASLGSASQELGNWQEQQRANELPLYAARAQVGAMKGQLTNRQAAAKEFEAARAKGFQDVDMPGLIARLESLGAAPELVSGAKEALAARSSVAGTQSTKAGTEGSILSNQAFMSSNPWLKGAAESVSDIDQKTSEQVAEVNRNLDKSRPMSIDPITWANMLPKAKLDQISTFASTQQEVSKEEEAKARDKATAAQDLLPHLLASRNLVVGNGPNDPNALAPLLGKLQGPEFFDAIAREVDKNGMANGGWSSSIASLLKDSKIGATPEQINRIQVLVKDLAAMQADRRDTASNPTNLYQSLRAAGSPSADNTGNAIVRMFDMLALGAAKEQDSYSARIDSKMDARHLPTSGPLRDITTLHSNMRKELAATDPTVETPSFYTKPTFWDNATKTVPKAISLTGPAAPAAPKFEEGKIYKDAQNNRAKYVNGKWEAQ